MLSNRQHEKKEQDGNVAPTMVEFPEAAHFALARDPTAGAPETVTTTIEAAADVTVGESIVESAGVGGGILLMRRQRWKPH